eukprot:506659_1
MKLAAIALLACVTCVSGILPSSDTTGRFLHGPTEAKFPESLDWRNVSGKSFASWNRNQNWCASCWAIALTSALSDRFNIMFNAEFPEISLSPQTLLSCDPSGNGCKFGSIPGALNYIQKYGIPPEDCAPYRAAGSDTHYDRSSNHHSNLNGGVACSNNHCTTCMDPHRCRKVFSYRRYFVDSFGALSGERNMIAELANGPIVCRFAHSEKFKTKGYKPTPLGIYSEDLGPESSMRFDHSVSVAGYGEENGVKYWIVRNGWGSNWGDNGWFRTLRGAGTHNLGIESRCYYAVPRR